jgi:hypothetical protein
MKKKLISQSAFLNRRVLISIAFCAIGFLLTLIALALYPGATARAQGPQQNQSGLLTPEEARRMAQQVKPLVNRSTQGLVQVQHPNGSISMNLQERFQNVILAKKEANGAITNACVDTPEAAAAFLQIDPQSVGTAPITNQPAELADR